MSKNLLLVDTSSSFCYMACFVREGGYSWSKQFEILISLSTKETWGTTHNNFSLKGDRWLSDAIQFLLKQNNCKKFDYLALGEGPGFFTALRVGHVTLATLALLWDSELLHFSSLEFWHEFFNLNNQVVFALRANQNLFYIHSYVYCKNSKSKITSKTTSFLSMNTQQLIKFSQENPNQIICLWQESWNNHVVNKKFKNTQNQLLDNFENKIRENKKIISTPKLEEAFQNQKQNIPQCIEGDIQNKIITIQEFIPVYGHQVLISNYSK